MSSPQYQSGNGVRYTMIYQDSTSIPTAVADTAYNLSAPVPAGLIEQVGFRLSGTTVGGTISAASAAEIVSGIRFTLNGDQVFNLQTQANDADSINCSRMGAMLQDIGGFVVEDSSLTNMDCTLWMPLGLNAPVNSRFELALNFITANQLATGYTFECWIKYGKSTNLTLVGNQTSQSIANAAQTMVSVKIPTIAGATVAGIAIQGARASDNMSGIIPKILGDFSQSPTFLRGASGANANGYQFPHAAVGAGQMQYSNEVSGYYFCPLYNAIVSDGSVVLLITSTSDDVAADSEFYTFTPILNLPTSGSGERTARQSSGAATGSKGAILSRAEDL